MAKFEDVVPYMYADNEDLVTCGIGDKIDPLGHDVLTLGWVHTSDGSPASEQDIVAEWHAVKAGKIHAWPRPLMLPPAALEHLFFSRLDLNEGYLSRRFARWADFPADAQLGCHSCAWAAGAHWTAPHFDAAAAAVTPDGFRVCSGTAGTNGNDVSLRGEAWLRDTRPEDDARGIYAPTLNSGLRPRNLANQWLFQNAAVVLADGYDPDALVWPTHLDG
jgi:hypothetical protein